MRRVWLLGLVLAACGARPTAVESAAARAPALLTADRVHVLSSEGSVVELRLSFRAGSADDPPGREGLTRLTARAMLQGSAGGQSYAERTRRLYPMAAELDLQVGREQTTFVARVHRDHVDAFYPLWLATLRAPDFREDDLARLRAQQRVELVQGLRGADDEALGKATLQAMLYEGHPYAHPPEGTEAGLAAIGVSDLTAQRARLLCAPRLTLGVAGPLEKDREARLRADLGALQSAACEAAPAALPAPKPSAQRVWIVEKPEAPAVAISAGLHLPVTRSHPDYPALMLAAAYLGQHRTFAGTLMQTIRVERGLNYGDYAYAEHFAQHGEGAFPAPNVARRQQYFSLWLRPLAPAHAVFALRAALRELTRLREGDVSDADFARIQQFADRYFALFAQTRQLALGHVLDGAFYGVPGPTMAAVRRRIRGLTRQAFLAAVRRHLDPSELRIALVAPDAAALRTALCASETPPPTYPQEVTEAIEAEDAQIARFPLGVSPKDVRIVASGGLFVR